MMNQFPLLTSQRLRLRALELQDEQEIFALRSNEEVNLHLDREPAKTVADAREFILKIRSMIENDDGLYWAICLKENPRLIGTICFFNFSKDKSTAEIGFEIHPFYQGKGIMQEAVALVVQFGLQVLELKKIIACPSIANLRSIQLLRRTGFKETQNHDEEENMMKFVVER